MQFRLLCFRSWRRATVCEAVWTIKGFHYIKTLCSLISGKNSALAKKKLLFSSHLLHVSIYTRLDFLPERWQSRRRRWYWRNGENRVRQIARYRSWWTPHSSLCKSPGLSVVCSHQQCLVEKLHAFSLAARRETAWTGFIWWEICSKIGGVKQKAVTSSAISQRHTKHSSILSLSKRVFIVVDVAFSSAGIVMFTWLEKLFEILHSSTAAKFSVLSSMLEWFYHFYNY